MNSVCDCREIGPISKHKLKVFEYSSDSDEDSDYSEGLQSSPSDNNKRQKVDIDVEIPVSSHTAMKQFVPACAPHKRPEKVHSFSTKTVLVRGLSPNRIKLADFVNLFEGAGEISNVWFYLNKHQVFQGTAFVKFTTNKAAWKALKFNGASLDVNETDISVVLNCDLGFEVALQSRSEPESYKKKHVSGKQSGGGLMSHQVHVSRMQIEMDTPSGYKRVVPNHYILKRGHGFHRDGEETIVSFERKFAKIALKSYEERMGVKFRVLKVLFSNRALLAVPGFGLDRLWCHVSFIAKPISADCWASHSAKHFFGEMVYNCVTKEYDVNFCSIFEPSDPENVEGCVFCPANPIFVHPAHGCPAAGRENIDIYRAQTNLDDDYIKQTIGKCSMLHPERPYIFEDKDENKHKYFEMFESLRYGYAKIALEFYEKRKGGKFQIVDILRDKHSPAILPGLVITEWHEIYFKARSKIVDCCYVPPQHFIGELLRDVTTGNYKVLYCEMFKPEKSPGCSLDEDCYDSYPESQRFVGCRDIFAVPEFTEYLVNMSYMLTPNQNKT